MLRQVGLVVLRSAINDKNLKYEIETRYCFTEFVNGRFHDQ